MTLKILNLSDNQDISQMVKLTPIGNFYIDLIIKYETRNN